MIKLKNLLSPIFLNEISTYGRVSFDDIPIVDSSVKNEFAIQTKPIFIPYVLAKEYLYLIKLYETNIQPPNSQQKNNIQNILLNNYKKMFPEISNYSKIINNFNYRYEDLKVKIKSAHGKTKTIPVRIFLFGPIENENLNTGGETILINKQIFIRLSFDSILLEMNSFDDVNSDNLYFIQHLTKTSDFKNLENELEKNIKIRKNKILSVFDRLLEVFTHEISHVLDMINQTLILFDYFHDPNDYYIVPTEIKAHINELIELFKSIKRKTGKEITRNGFYYLISRYSNIVDEYGKIIPQKVQSSVYYRGIKLPSIFLWLYAVKILDSDLYDEYVKSIYKFLKQQGVLKDD